MSDKHTDVADEIADLLGTGRFDPETGAMAGLTEDPIAALLRKRYGAAPALADDVAALIAHARTFNLFPGNEDKDIIQRLATALESEQSELDAAHDVLRSLASFVGNGGYNAPTVDAAIFEAKIRDGIETVIRVEKQRARTEPRVSDSEMTQLLRRTSLELEAELRALKGKTDGHPEDYCHRCGGRNIGWYADSDLWNQFDPPESIICPICFVIEAEAGGVKTAAWRVAPGDESDEANRLFTRLHEALEVLSDPAALHVHILRTWDRERIRSLALHLLGDGLYAHQQVVMEGTLKAAQHSMIRPTLCDKACETNQVYVNAHTVTPERTTSIYALERLLLALDGKDVRITVEWDKSVPA